jgi:GWxTD domain-containing protein
MMKSPVGGSTGRTKEKVMRRNLIPLALAALLVASAAGAELSQTYKDWPTGPAGFLLTDSERTAYSELQTDARAKNFIDLFWARRDPDLNTVQNEFKLDFEMRVAAADKQFGTATLKGSLTDRAKVLYLMGKPEAVENVKAGQGSAGNLPEFVERGASQIWIYTKDHQPVTDQTKKSDEIMFVFSETTPGAGDFKLDHADRRNRQAFKVLADMPEKLLLHPKLTEVPEVGLLPGSKAATPEQEAVFDVQPRPWPQGAVELATSGVASETIHPVWVYVQLPDDAAPATEAIGRVRNAESGAAVGTFQESVNAMGVPSGRAYEFSIPVEAGSWKVDLALLGANGPVAVRTIDAKNDAAPAEGPYISPIYWGGEARQTAEAHLGDAYHLGGMQLIPEPDNLYKADQNITYAAYVVRPSLDEQGKPNIELSIALYAGGKKNDEQPYQTISGVKIHDDIWVFGQMLPLSGFHRGVAFELRVGLRDAKTGVTRTGTIPFTVVQEPIPTPAATAPPATEPKK